MLQKRILAVTVLGLLALFVLAITGCMIVPPEVNIGPVTTLGNFSPVLVNYDQPLAVGIKIANLKLVVEGLKEENFPRERDGTAVLNMGVMHVSRATTAQVYNDMEALGLQSATLRELLAFASAFPLYPPLVIRTPFSYITLPYNDIVAMGSVNLFEHQYFEFPQLVSVDHTGFRMLTTAFAEIGTSVWIDQKFLVVRK